MRSQRERMAVVGSRIVSAQRSSCQDTEEGCFLALRVALGAAFSPTASPQVIQLAADSFLWSRTLFQFVIDRLNSDGYALDYVLRGACEAASGHDATGTLPIVFLLTVACIHLFVYGFHGAFGRIHIRTMISII